MGQKIHPTGFRLVVSRDWSSRWYAKKHEFAAFFKKSILVRAHIKKMKDGAISRVIIEKTSNAAKITIRSARVSRLIGKKGEALDILKKQLQILLGGMPVHINVEEVKKPELDAQLISENIAQQLEKRVMFRRAMKRSIQNAMRLGAQGVKIECSGRLNGIEIARSEWYREGRVPLHTLRANIEYGTSTAHTTYGAIGIKVWVYKGDTLGRKDLDVASSGYEEEKKRKRTNDRPNENRRDDDGRNKRVRKATAKPAGFVEHSADQAKGG
jgi:small subunit ribosomal protein S3